MPVLQNVAEGQWDSVGTTALLHDGKARAQFIARLIPALTALHAAGAMFDLRLCRRVRRRIICGFCGRPRPCCTTAISS